MSKSESKKDYYEKVIQVHLEKGPISHDYSYGFLVKLINDINERMDKKEQVIYIQAPVNICGDIRSKYSDLLDVFKKAGWPFDTKYLFLGNFFDGGQFSIEVLVLLMSCKLCYPNSFTMLRGSLENSFLTSDSNFIGELRVKYPESNQWVYLTQLFKSFIEKLPLCAVLNKKIMCVNSSISTNVTNEKSAITVRNGVYNSNRTTQIEVNFAEIDVPHSITPKKIEEESKHTQSMLKTLDMSLIVNSNDVMRNGYHFFNNHTILTLTTGSAISHRFNNKGVVMTMDHMSHVKFKHLTPADADYDDSSNVLRN